MSKPLATLFIPCYQQAPYIRASIQSALAQEYQPLEIFVSDDCSTDGTFDIAREECAKYAGPHTIVLHRNSTNLGAAENTNQAVKKMRGEMIAVHCGDDMSTPNRLSIVMDAWQKHKVPVITSNVFIMTPDGTVTGVRRSKDEPMDLSLEYFMKNVSNVACYGASQCFQRELFLEFGPLETEYSPFNGDHIIPFWGLLKGGNAFITQPLVYHRYNLRSDGWKNHTTAHSVEERAESMLSHNIAQGVYILTTLDKFMEKNGLQKDVKYLTARVKLIETLLNYSISWVKVRSNIKRSGKKSMWVDYDQVS